jgi:hypothetical protein
MKEVTMVWKTVLNEEYVNLKTGMTSTALIADRETDVFGVERVDNVCIQLEWSGSPVGKFELWASVDNVVFCKVDYDEMPTSVGSPILINFPLCPYKWLKVKYVYTSGTGTLTKAIANAKSLS